MKHSESVTELAKALSAAQGEFPAISCDAENPFFHSRYATLGQLWKAVKPILAKHGLAIIQGEVGEDIPSPNAPAPTKALGITTMLLHASGEYISFTMFLPLDKQTPQAYGSAMTYARRYGLAAMLGLVSDEDDDAEGATRRAKTPPSKETSERREPGEPDKQEMDSATLLDFYAEKIRGATTATELNAIQKTLRTENVRDKMLEPDGDALLAQFKDKQKELA